MKRADLRNMFKKASKSACTSNVVLSPELLSPPLSTSSALKTPEHTEEDYDDLEPAYEGDIQIQYCSD
jgi:hypothetical protein